MENKLLTYNILLIVQDLIMMTKNKKDGKKSETCGIKYKSCDCFLEYTNFNDDLIEYKWLYCNKHYQQIQTLLTSLTKIINTSLTKS